MTIGILGAGFGLYGYLPAVFLAAGAGERPVMPARYRDKLLSRDELRGFDSSVDWAGDEAEVIARSDTLIFARRPVDQFQALETLLAAPRLKRVLLEKPLAPAPDQAREMLERLGDAGKTVRIGFTFNRLPWAMRLREWLAEARDSGPDIVWRFRAHHYANDLDTWKRQPALGGGALRFYGIQLIGLLAECGYSGCDESVTEGSADDVSAWRAVLTGPGLPLCRVAVDSDAPGWGFTVHGAGLDHAAGDPFDDAPAEPGQDRRVRILAGLVDGLLEGGEPDWYGRSVRLWSAVEEADMLRPAAGKG